MDFEKLLEQYNYPFPENLIAQKPASPRDNAKLLIYKKSLDKVFFDTFLNLPQYLPKGAVLVFNQTKVIPARLELKKETGGKLKILITNIGEKNIEAIADRKLIVGSKIFLTEKIFFTVESQKEQFFYLRPSFPIKNLDKLLLRYGHTPIPPYIKNSPLTEKDLREKYQAIFAKNKGSVAAPTASLHFTSRLIKKLKKSGVEVKFVTLHVGMGTFAPLQPDNISSQKLHSEFYEIDRKTAEFLNEAKKEGRPIIPVGSTACRALESASIKSGHLKKLSGITNIFIREGDQFKFIDGLITNFHVPQSSLLMLVAALINHKKLFELYRMAIKKKFRLFSFGDGMLIIE